MPDVFCGVSCVEEKAVMAGLRKSQIGISVEPLRPSIFEAVGKAASLLQKGSYLVDRIAMAKILRKDAEFGRLHTPYHILSSEVSGTFRLREREDGGSPQVFGPQLMISGGSPMSLHAHTILRM